jgi:hypothetical protein
MKAATMWVACRYREARARPAPALRTPVAVRARGHAQLLGDSLEGEVRQELAGVGVKIHRRRLDAIRHQDWSQALAEDQAGRSDIAADLADLVRPRRSGSRELNRRACAGILTPETMIL